jgi:hypothetical protein
MAKQAEPDLEKLPMWAQDLIRRMQNRISDLEGVLTIARREAPDKGATGKVIADIMGAQGFPLHDRCAVKFSTDTGPITAMLRDGKLGLNAEWGGLSILPRASNSALVVTEKR